jgi:hypothetical protein
LFVIFSSKETFKLTKDKTFYPPIGDNRDQLLKIEQDAIFDCGSRRLLEDQAESFMYIFDAVSPTAYKHWSREYQWVRSTEKINRTHESIGQLREESVPLYGYWIFFRKSSFRHAEPKKRCEKDQNHNNEFHKINRHWTQKFERRNSSKFNFLRSEQVFWLSVYAYIFLVPYNRRKKRSVRFGIKSLFYLRTAQRGIKAAVLLIGRRYPRLSSI